MVFSTQNILFEGGNRLSICKAHESRQELEEKSPEITPRTRGLKKHLASCYNKNATVVTFLDLNFLILSPVSSCKQGRKMWFDKITVILDQNLMGNGSAIINDSLSK